MKRLTKTKAASRRVPSFLVMIAAVLFGACTQQLVPLDEAAARALADTVAAEFIDERYAEVQQRMESGMKASLPKGEISPAFEIMNTTFGKAREVRFSKIIRGRQMQVGQRRVFHRYWYDVRTTKADMGKYFLWIDIVQEGDHLACAAIQYAVAVGAPKKDH